MFGGFYLCDPCGCWPVWQDPESLSYLLLSYDYYSVKFLRGPHYPFFGEILSWDPKSHLHTLACTRKKNTLRQGLSSALLARNSKSHLYYYYLIASHYAQSLHSPKTLNWGPAQRPLIYLEPQLTIVCSNYSANHG